ncbi:hypothetical protein SAMN02910447_00553 [Ruminococcus sp. YE71]|uniref:hypothetical protein n=1 Tax=unclassified Ruminococcus TaxID=2608920 RepID=UPI00088E55E6|nr:MULTISPECIES: hypothetical protein [unclassified Ruminococcus]SDA12198.1 hypothetical protein SAMN02910446_00552 [Ruminococcus sp. YE78]SFW16523.1 hypothetical protein SAMN02910447_00553 [Ruminococcus sp. YE71]
MTFDAIYAAAVDTVNRIAAGGEVITPDKTVCVICTPQGRIYYGVSRAEPVNGVMTEKHAEIDAVMNMQSYGDTAIGELILINAMSGTALLPCSGCVNYILSQGPENAGALVAMPDRMIPLQEVARFAGGGQMPPPVQNSAPLRNISAKGDLLKDRLSSIMDGVDDDDDDDEFLEELDQPKGKKKKLFGLFG